MQYRAEIDGLRAVAVTPVILFHAGLGLFSGGFVGVDVFFVISGYLITTILLNELEAGRFSIVHFYERRARRILPTLFVVMLFCLPFAAMWMLSWQLKDFAQSLVAVTLFSSNVLFWREDDYFATTAEEKPLLHTWSLAVEEQYYLLFPLLLMLLWRFGRRPAFVVIPVLAAGSLLLSEVGWRISPTTNFYLAPTRAWELLIGSICAMVQVARPPQANGALAAAGLGLILYAIFRYDSGTAFPSLYALAPTLGTALVILYGGGATLVGRLLSTRPFVGIGLISYSAYLWHQPLLAFARLYSLRTPPTALMLAISGAALGLAYVSWKYVEAPFRNRAAYGRRAIFRLSAIGAMFFIATGVAVHLANGFERLHHPAIMKLHEVNLGTLEAETRDCWNRFSRTPSISAACAIGNTRAAPSFAVFGDSHAGALIGRIDAISAQKGLAGLNYTFRSCPPLEGVEPARPNRLALVCRDLRRSFFEGLRTGADIPHTVVLSARWTRLIEQERFDNGEGGIEPGRLWSWKLSGSDQGVAEAMTRRMVQSIAAILKTGRRVVLVYPIPEMGWPVPVLLSKLYRFEGRIAPQDGATLHSVYRARNRRTIAALDAIEGGDNLIRIRPERILCDTFVKGRCAAHLNGEPLYLDDDHLSPTGAGLVAAEIVKHLESPPPGRNDHAAETRPSG